MIECRTCRYWEKPKWESDVWGECRRHAPIVAEVEVIIGGQYRQDDWPKARWPKTQNAHSCGDYEPREGAA